MLVLKLCFVINLSLLVATEYVFRIGRILLKNPSGVRTKRVTYQNVKAIDQHRFATAVDMKITTDAMTLFEGAIKNLPELEALRLKSCEIYEIPPHSFLNLPRLKMLHLQDNHIREIRSGVFNYMSIEELWLQRNAIIIIASNAFDNMPNLVEIKLNQNLIRHWDSNWFFNCPKLTRLFFSRNKIEELPKQAFANLKTSHRIKDTELVDTSINLNGNKISKIHPDAFRGIDSLYELRLKRNRIRTIDDVFSHFTELHVLNLQRNKLKEVNKKTFESLNEMAELNLSENSLTCIPHEIVLITYKLNVTGNANMDCNCLRNLRDMLQEKGSSHTVYNDARC